MTPLEKDIEDYELGRYGRACANTAVRTDIEFGVSLGAQHEQKRAEKMVARVKRELLILRKQTGASKSWADSLSHITDIEENLTEALKDYEASK